MATSVSRGGVGLGGVGGFMGGEVGGCCIATGGFMGGEVGGCCIATGGTCGHVGAGGAVGIAWAGAGGRKGSETGEESGGVDGDSDRGTSKAAMSATAK